MVNVHQFASTLAHEVEVHMNRHFYGRSRLGWARAGTKHWYKQEIEAYNHEIANQERFGYSDSYMKNLVANLKRAQANYEDARY